MHLPTAPVHVARCEHASYSTLLAAASAASALESALGEFHAETPALIASYRRILAQPEFDPDLQLHMCDAPDAPNRPFSRVEGAKRRWLLLWPSSLLVAAQLLCPGRACRCCCRGPGGFLHVDTEKCPRAVYSEADLPPAGASADDHDEIAGGPEGGVARRRRYPGHPVELQTDGVVRIAAPPRHGIAARDLGVILAVSQVVTCDGRSLGVDDSRGGDEPLDEGERSDDEISALIGESVADPETVDQNLWLGVSPATTAWTPPPDLGAQSVDADANEGRGAPPTASPPLSAVILVVDATSRAHFARMCPRTSAALRSLEASGAAHVYDFPLYSIVGESAMHISASSWPPHLGRVTSASPRRSAQATTHSPTLRLSSPASTSTPTSTLPTATPVGRRLPPSGPNSNEPATPRSLRRSSTMAVTTYDPSGRRRRRSYFTRR